MNYAFKIMAVVMALGVLVLGSTVSYSSNYIDNLHPKHICFAATTFDDFKSYMPKLMWKKNDKFKFWVSLAKSKNLNCSIGKNIRNYLKEDSRPFFYNGSVCLDMHILLVIIAIIEDKLICKLQGL